MERDQLAKAHITTSSSSFVSLAKAVVLLKGVAKKLISILLMLIFTGSAFVILAISVVLLAAESLVSAALSPIKAPKEEDWQDILKDKSSRPSEVSQTK